MLKIIKQKKPKIVFLENVKNFKTIFEGEPFKFIVNELNNYGYFVTDTILNTCEFTNIPQNRERIFILGFLDKDVFDNFIFPCPVNNKHNVSDYLEKNIDNCYYYTESSAIYEKLKNSVVNKNVVYQYRRHYVRENKNNNVPTLTANMGSGGHNVPIILDKKGIRKLTPKECFNFQGFPKNYKLPQTRKSALYKQAGNSVTVELIKKITINIYYAILYSNLHCLMITKNIIKKKITSQ